MFAPMFLIIRFWNGASQAHQPYDFLLSFRELRCHGVFQIRVERGP
jgi:hypothetical protein